jgi:hypothetical protein
MFCIVFVFSCILQVLEENPSNSKIIMKSANSLLERIKCQIKFDFKKREVGKIFYFWKESKMNTSQYFGHNFLLKYRIALKLISLER